MEVTARCARSSESASIGAATRSECRILTQKPRTNSRGHLRHGDRRGETKAGGRGGARAAEGEGKGCLGWPYCNEGWHTGQVFDKRQFRRTDCCHPPRKGSRPVRPLRLSDELCDIEIIFTDKIRTPLAQALALQRRRLLLLPRRPHSLSLQNLSTWRPKIPHILLQQYRRDHSLRRCIPHPRHLSCSLHSTIRD